MEQVTILKGYRYFDTFYTLDNIPHDLIADWGHKESLQDIFILVTNEERKEIESEKTASLYDYSIFYSESDAIEEMKEWNN